MSPGVSALSYAALLSLRRCEIVKFGPWRAGLDVEEIGSWMVSWEFRLEVSYPGADVRDGIDGGFEAPVLIP